MSHVVSHPRAPFRSADGALEVHQVPAAKDNLVWILVCTATREAAYIDGPDAGAALAHAEAHGLTPRAVFNTHVHGDHIGINRDLARRGLLDGFRVVGARRTASAVPGLTEPVADGDLVTLGAVTGRVLETEGHIDGHISFVFGDLLFCGDTLFGAGCGYLFDGPPRKMHESLERLAALPPETRVCCAHEYTEDNLRFAYSLEPGNEALAARIARVFALRARGESSVPSTIGEERETNPFLRHESPELRAHLARAMPDAALGSALEIFTATRALKNQKNYISITDEQLPIAARRS
jgi:hydroxyacylglutathione hydrolase